MTINININGVRLTRDASWNEAEHKRDHGQFSATGGAKGPTPIKAHTEVQSAPKPATVHEAGQLRDQWQARHATLTKNSPHKKAEIQEAETHIKVYSEMYKTMLAEKRAREAREG